MADRVDLALQALRKLRSGHAYRQLPQGQQAEMDSHLRHLENALDERNRAGSGRGVAAQDRYAALLGTPADLQRQLGGDPSPSAPAPAALPATAPAQAPLPPAPGTGQIGDRAAAALEAVNFSGFVASLVTGTFQAIVDASTRQIKEYANLVASLSTTLEDFSRDNVTPNQVRDWFAERFPADVGVVLPAPGKTDTPKLVPRAGREGTSPEWLRQYGLGGQELSQELTEGPLIDAGRNKVGEERMQTLATLVLMGINRIVVGDGDITARLQFHAAARESTKADMDTQQASIAAQAVPTGSAMSMMVSTVKANAQADATIKADLLGEVRIAFRSETFPLERFADSAAIQLINRHAGWKKQAPAASVPADAPAIPPPPTATAEAPAPAGGGK